MRDLDMGDVLADARNQRDEYVSSLTEHHDPADLLTVLAVIHYTYFDGADDRIDELIDSDLTSELVQATQSNPDGVIEDLRKALRAANADI